MATQHTGQFLMGGRGLSIIKPCHTGLRQGMIQIKSEGVLLNRGYLAFRCGRATCGVPGLDKVGFVHVNQQITAIVTSPKRSE